MWRLVLRRTLDLVVAAPALLLLLPLLLLLALCIKLDSAGPVFFRQQRVGRSGALFDIHKFRTMVQAQPADALALTVGEDVRITRTGRWLRRTRLDELPQLLDVLRGDMALVGPRPEVPRYVALYPPALKARVLAVRPGITDPSSLAFLDEAQELAQAADAEQHYVLHILPRKLTMAADYADRATVWTDLGVLLQTALRLLGRARRS
jgi:lipopolysaccharide/colanic/teichoic acid biosynthesis glycosyltransferase